MRVDPSGVEGGHPVSVRFVGPKGNNRGGCCYVLLDAAGVEVAGLWSEKMEGGVPGFTTHLDQFVVLDLPFWRTALTT